MLFASEVKALFTVPGVTRKLNLSAVGDVMTYWSALSPDTVFEGVQSLPPGHLLTIENGQETLACYWDWVFPTETPHATRPEADYAEELRELLVDAVRLQLRADVTVGAYLSGGLDSSAISALVRRYHQKSLITFSIAFEDPNSMRAPFSRRWRSTSGPSTRSALPEERHRCCVPGCDSVTRRRRSCAPLLRSLMLLSKAVRQQGLKVVLTGEGADEVFGGYDIYKEALIRRFWARQPQRRSRGPRCSTACIPISRIRLLRRGCSLAASMARAERRASADVRAWPTLGDDATELAVLLGRSSCGAR